MREALQTLEYGGEYGYELALVIPHAYWLHCRGRLAETRSVGGTGELYYFSPRHRELARRRRFEKAPGPNRDYRRLCLEAWQPPPYREIFQGLSGLPDLEELVVVHNKYGSEWGGPPVNFLDCCTLRALLQGLLARGRRVVYIRPCADERGYVADDNQALAGLQDHAMLRQDFPGVLLFQDLLAASPHMDYNSLQMRLHADCRRFVSVQGGNSVLASYFGGTNVVLAVKGPELVHGVFESLYPRLSGCRVVVVSSGTQLVEQALELL